MEIFETDKWSIFPKKSMENDIKESYIEFVFRLKNDPREIRNLPKEDLQELKEDLKDLGKWREFKKLKKDLEE